MTPTQPMPAVCLRPDLLAGPLCLPVGLAWTLTGLLGKRQCSLCHPLFKILRWLLSALRIRTRGQPWPTGFGPTAHLAPAISPPTDPSVTHPGHPSPPGSCQVPVHLASVLVLPCAPGAAFSAQYLPGPPLSLRHDFLQGPHRLSAAPVSHSLRSVLVYCDMHFPCHIRVRWRSVRRQKWVPRASCHLGGLSSTEGALAEVHADCRSKMQCWDPLGLHCAYGRGRLPSMWGARCLCRLFWHHEPLVESPQCSCNYFSLLV